MAGRKIVVFNRKASHEYFLEERFEAGLVLQGTEIKSIRQGHVQIRDAYISFTFCCSLRISSLCRSSFRILVSS